MVQVPLSTGGAAGVGVDPPPHAEWAASSEAAMTAARRREVIRLL
jgi:hypothetical protein